MSVLIIGGGVGGLTAAHALARRGKDVTLIEKSPRPEAEAGEGLQLGINALRFLAAEGLLDSLTAIGAFLSGARIHEGRGGKLIATASFEGRALKRWRMRPLAVRRADLVRVLAESLRSRPNVSFFPGWTFRSFSKGEGASLDACISDDQGQERLMKATLIVGADGVASLSRVSLQNLGLLKLVHPFFSGRVAWRAVLSRDRLLQEPASYADLWIRENAHVVTYPLRCGEELNVVVARRAAKADARFQGPQTSSITWPDSPRALIAACPTWSGKAIYDCQPLDALFCRNVVLLGDAAHPMTPFLAQGASQAIEDACVLGAVFRDAATLGQDLAVYERLRKDRVARTQRQSRRQGSVYHAPAPLRRMIDAALPLLLHESVFVRRYDWLYGYHFDENNLAR